MRSSENGSEVVGLLDRNCKSFQLGDSKREIEIFLDDPEECYDDTLWLKQVVKPDLGAHEHLWWTHRGTPPQN